MAMVHRRMDEGNYPKCGGALDIGADLLDERERRSWRGREWSKLDAEEEGRMARDGPADTAWPAFRLRGDGVQYGSLLTG